MKQKLLNSIRLRIALLVALLCSLGTGSVWADGTLVSALSGISNGKTYYIAAYNSSKYYTVPNTTIDAQTFTCTEGSLSGSTLTPVSGAGEFVFTAVDGVANAYYIYNTNLEKYLVATASKKFGYVTSANSDYGYWTFTTVSSGGFSGQFSVKHSSKSQYMRAYSNSVRCYDGASNNGVYLFEKSTPCATPTFSVAAGEVTKNTVVTISSTTTGSTIYYTTDNSTPTTSSTHGTAGDASVDVTITSDMTVKAIAVKDGYSNSTVASAAYTTAKTDNTITVTGGATQNIALTGGSAIEDGMYDLSEIVSATHGNIGYTIKSTENLTEGVDFEFAEGLFEFTNTYKGIIVVTASVPADEDYNAVEQDITINCSGDLRTPTYSFSDGDKLAMGQTITVANGTNIASDGAITLTSSNTSVATVNNTTKVITPVAVGKTNITIATAEGTYYASGSKTFELEVEYAKGTAQNPYTVAEARAKIDTESDLTGKYVHGIISQVDSYNSTYESITYWISDDGTTTNQFEVYGGLKSYNNESGSFSAKTDLEVGDIVTVYGDLTKYKSTYELDANNYLVSFFRKANSDLTLTSSTPVALEMTTATPHPTSEITYSTSSTGAMTFTTSDGSVATVSDGVITAVGAGSATITFSQAADEAYKASTNKTVTVNVTDNRSACATGIDLTSAKTITKNASAAISATSTKADGFTGEITYSYSSANSSIFSIVDGNYSGAGVGATTVTVTATPTGGNADNYKPASQEVAVTVNGTNSISLSETSKSVAYGAAAFNITATVPTENYDGTVTASSSNTSVATVSVDGTTVTVTPVAVGSATITVTAGTGNYYPATAQTTCVLTVTAPAGSGEAPSSALFSESFSSCNGTGGNKTGTFSNGSQNGSVSGKTDESSYSTITSAYPANGCARLGTGSDNGVLSFTVSLSGNASLTFSGAGWKGSDTNTISVTATGATLSGDTEVTLTNAEWNDFSIDITDATGSVTITFTEKRGFLDDIVISQAPTATVSLNASGYATYCSVNPIDFSEAEGYTAWYIESITKEGVITFNKITGTIKGGQGVLLYDKNATAKKNVTVKFADSSNELSGNKLVGTTAPTYVEAGAVYGLKGSDFVVSSANGVIPANRAYISASSIPAGVKSFTFVFEDITTGVTETRTATREEVEAIFNLNGQRMSKMQRGINIVNGKKVLVK